MKIVMMGSGGVGGYYGARLLQAGHEVVFVARGAHAQAMRERGLTIRSELGDASVKARVVEDPAQAGVTDAVVIAVKLWDTAQAAQAVKPIVGPKTTAVSLQNGVDKDDVLAAALGRERVIGGVTHIAAVIAEPGVIAHTGKLQRVTIGELPRGAPTTRVLELLRALQSAKIDAAASDDIAKVTWEKFVFLTALSGMTSLTRNPVGPVRENPATRAMLLDALRETAAVARAEGVPLDDDLPQKQLAMIDGLNPAMTSSMAGDLARGKRLELDWLSGAVVQRAAKHGLAVPTHRAIYAALVLHAKG